MGKDEVSHAHPCPPIPSGILWSERSQCSSKNPFLGLGRKGLVLGHNSLYSQVSTLAQEEDV